VQVDIFHLETDEKSSLFLGKKTCFQTWEQV